jgi:hypothetical protein
VPHQQYQPSLESLVCPRYFSTAPVPPNPTGSFSVVVRLPDEYLKNKAMSSTKLFLRGSFLLCVILTWLFTCFMTESNLNSLITFLIDFLSRVCLSVADSANEAIEKALKKCSDGLDPTEFIFKVIGRGEYIYGQEPVMDYEVCLRLRLMRKHTLFVLLFGFWLILR